MAKIDFSTKPAGAQNNDYFKALLGGDKNSVMNLAVERLTPYPNQPFKPYTDTKLAELAESIAVNGVLSPVLVRKQGEQYQILAGHNRVNAAKLIGLAQVPCIIKEVDDDDALLIVVSTNLAQRDELLPSEKAMAYKLQLETLKRQGARTDLTSSHYETKYLADETLAKSAGISRAQIQRYIRLTYLVTEFLDMVDEKTLSLLAGEQLSYLSQDDQETLLYFLENNHIRTISVDQAKALREVEIDNDSLSTVFHKPEKEKKQPKEKTIPIHLPLRLLSQKASGKAIDDALLEKIADTIERYFAEQEGEVQ